MHCWIYKSVRHEGLYVYLAEENNFSIISESIATKLGKLEFVMDIDLSSKKLAQEDAEQVIKNITESGFHLQLPDKFASKVLF
jgi:uncharacterized protein